VLHETPPHFIGLLLRKRKLAALLLRRPNLLLGGTQS
jgi:hypothetical protein